MGPEDATPAAGGPPAQSTGSALVRSSALVAVGTALSRITGLLRVFAFIYALDQTWLTDSYTVANTMPNLIYELLLGGVLSATLVPIFTERLRDEDGGVSAVVSVTSVVLVVVTVVGFFAAPAIFAIFARALGEATPAEVAAYRDVGTTLLRFFMPQVLFYGLVTVVTALLHARRSFLAPAYAPVLNNLVVSAMFVALPTVFDRALRDDGSVVRAADDSTLLLLLGLGTTAGVAAMALALVPSLLRQRVGLRFRPDFRHPAVRTLVSLSGWTVGYVVANQIALTTVLWLATSQSEGDATAYAVAFIFFQLPHGLFAVSIMTTFLPELTAAAQSGDIAAFRRRFTLGLRLMALVVLPASAGYVALSGPIVNLLPLRGASAEVTAGVLVAFSVGLFGFSVYLYALRGFYARKDTRTPFRVNVVENALNVGFAVPMVLAWGVQGLAGAYSAAYVIGAVLAVRALARHVGGLGLRDASGPMLRMSVAAVGCGVAAWLAAEALGGAGPIVRTAVGVPVGVAAYGVLLVALSVEEIDTARRMLRDRVRAARGRRSRESGEAPADRSG